MDDGEVAVDGDQGESDDADVDRELLDERCRGTEEVGQVPTLQQGRLELERDAEDSEGNVGHGEVPDEEVRHGLHVSVAHDHHDNQRVADDRDDGDDAVEDREQGDQTRRNVEQLFPVRAVDAHDTVLHPAGVRLQGGVRPNHIAIHGCLVAQ